MSTAALCGMNGSVSAADNVFYWEVTDHIDAVDGTSMDSDGWRERIACLKGAKGSFKTFDGISCGPTACTFQDAAAGYEVDGDIIVTKVTLDTPVDGAVTFNCEFVFTGTFTAS